MTRATRFSLPVVLPGIFVVAVLWIGRTAAAKCPSNNSLVGFRADIVMVQHQLRGSIFIVDDCTFTVTRFDMLPGIDVYWWGSLGDDIESLLSGQPVSETKLSGSYSNANMEVTLLSSLTWDDIKVLSVWDSATASNFGHIMLQSILVAPPPVSGGLMAGAPSSPALGPSSPALGPRSQLSPAPAVDSFSPPAQQQKVGERQPTMFDNCVSLTPSFRVRWTLGFVQGTVDIGLEYALTKTQYMAFGWAKPGSTKQYMLNSDVVVAGIDDKGVPLSEDYYVSSYSECNWDAIKPSGVCPDSLFAGTTKGLNNSQMLHSQQTDGITLVRYRRPLVSEDLQYDVSIDPTETMMVVWAMGSLASDSSRIHFAPQNHGMPLGLKYGYLNLTLGITADQCNGPLPASNASQGNIVVADRGTSLVVTSDVAHEYPNPPNPKKVLYINQKETPLLKVERGVPVTFVVQAGHDVSFYVTSNPIGGSPRTADKVYAGGSDAHGVPTLPYTLKWLPDRKTPDEVYYQAFFQKKMGWKVQVVDGGLSDMYNTSHLLANDEVSLFWTLTSTDVFLAVRGERKSGYLAVALGSQQGGWQHFEWFGCTAKTVLDVLLTCTKYKYGMLNSFAYVAWIDGQGNGHIGTYWIDDKDASGIHPTAEFLLNKKCERKDGIITFEFSRPLKPDCQSGQECKNVIDPTNALKMVWAMGDEWSDNLTNGNIHAMVSTTPTLIYLAAGAAKVEELQPVLAVHGFMMFLAWGVFFPGGVMAARYIKHINQNGWLPIHIYAQTSGVFVTFLGLLFAVAELRGTSGVLVFLLSSKRVEYNNIHMKLGISCILIVCLQASNGYLRPKKTSRGERQGILRSIWECFHLFMGRLALLLGFITLLTGVAQLGARDSFQHVKTLEWVVFAWFVALAAISGYIEMHDFWIRAQRYKSTIEQSSIIRDSEDDTADLLVPAQTRFLGQNSNEWFGALDKEIQLQAF